MLQFSKEIYMWEKIIRDKRAIVVKSYFSNKIYKIINFVMFKLIVAMSYMPMSRYDII